MYKIEIQQDEDAQNPRSLDYTDCNLGVMICFHNRYNLGDSHEYNTNNFNSWDELENQLKKDYNTDIILPLYLYDHSGITMNTTGFPCRWDSGQVGFIVLDRQQLLKTHGAKRITKSLREKLFTCLEGEVKTYDQYLTGDVWGYRITDESDEEVHSCWGFYGREYCEGEAELMLKSY